MIGKLCIGCAKFGINYGINKPKKKVLAFNEVEKIVRYAFRNGIKMFDVASDYGDSEKKLGKISKKFNLNLNIISKLPYKIKKSENISVWFNNSLNNSLKMLNKKKLYGLHVHNPSFLIGKEKNFFYEKLLEARALGKISKIGVSIYKERELEQIMSNFKIDIVQIPVNLFDRRFEKKGYLKYLKNMGVEIHARSIFLKGLLLTNRSQRPNFFKVWEKLFLKLDKWKMIHKTNLVKICLDYVNSLKEVDRIIIGCSDPKNIDIVLKNLKKPLKSIFPDPKVKDERLLLPYNWKN
jgi:hypothetical protein